MKEFPSKQWTKGGLEKLLKKIDQTDSVKRTPGSGRPRTVAEQQATLDFIPPTLWPPNSPDLNPVDYKIWSVMQEKVYKTKVRHVDDLRKRNERAWDELEQGIIDQAVAQWRARLRACVRAGGAQFEYKL